MLARLTIPASAALMLLAPPSLHAQNAGGVKALYNALGMPEIVEIMRDEGETYGSDIEDDMFPGEGGSDWDDLVADIYDPEKMETILVDRLSAELEGVSVEPLLEFFESGRGERIVELEVSARRALMEDAVEEAANESLLMMEETNDPRLALIRRFSDANELVESNVVGALNANYAFYTGLMDGGALPYDMTEDEILSDVWQQEPDIRIETEQWLYSYLAMAYKPLDDEDLRAYLALSETPEGQALNRALFAAFDEMFVQISHALGTGASRFMAGEKI